MLEVYLSLGTMAWEIAASWDRFKGRHWLHLCLCLCTAAPAATLAEQKAARGPSPDDPLDNPAAPSWVDGFNRSLDQPTINTAEGEPVTALSNSSAASGSSQTNQLLSLLCALLAVQHHFVGNVSSKMARESSA